MLRNAKIGWSVKVGIQRFNIMYRVRTVLRFSSYAGQRNGVSWVACVGFDVCLL